MSQIPANTRKAQVLGIIASGFTVKKDIQLTVKQRLGLSESTTQRLIKGYLADGSLQLKARHYSLTREGQEWLRKRQGTPELPLRDSKLRGIIDKLPTPQHRAFVYFILAAITAKLYLWDKEDTFWPSFLIGGLTGDIKTLLAEIVCETLKLPKAKHIQDTIRKTEAQVLGTFDKIVEGRRILDPAPYFSYVFITWDDLDKVSNRGVWKALMSYIDGWAYREERGTYVEKRHTCLVTMNFETATLQIPEPYLRRAFVIDSKGLHCDPMQNEIIGREIGKSLKNAPKLKIDGLTLTFKRLGEADMNFMRDLLYRGLRSKEEGRVVDTNFLEKIVLGWLLLLQSGDVRDAIYWAVEGALLFLQTQGRTKEDWRDELTTEWGNYRAGRNPDFAKEWEKHLEQVKSNGKQVEDYKEGKEEKDKEDKAIERGKEKARGSIYATKMTRLIEIRESYAEMVKGKKVSEILIWLDKDIKDLTIKKGDPVSQDRITELTITLDEWEEQHKPIREAWETEQKRLKEVQERVKERLRYLVELKDLLTTYFGRGKKDSNGVLWSHRTKEVRGNIGKVLNLQTRKEFYNHPFLNSIDERAQVLLTERREQKKAAKDKALGGLRLPESIFSHWTEEEKAEVIEEAVETYGEPSRGPTITVPYWQALLLKLGVMKLKKIDKDKPPKGFEGRDISDL